MNNSSIHRYIILCALLLVAAFKVSAQEELTKQQKEAKALVAQAEKALSENNFNLAEAKYREAISKDPNNAEAKYNLGNLYYNKEKTGESASRLTGASKVASDKKLKHRIYHNQGNAFMKQKKYEQAVAAYKNALRNDPTDDETRYNLALAKKKLQKQQQDNKKNKDKNKDKKNNKNQDQQQNKDKKDDKNGQDKKDNKGDKKDKGDQGKDKKDQQPKEGNKDKGKEKPNEQKPESGDQQKNGDKKQEGQPQQIQGKLSKQQVKNLLEAMENQEKKIQDKINAQKVKGQRTTSEKDW